MTNTCEVCSIGFESKREARTCSPKCRKDLSRINSVTHNVTLSNPVVTHKFKFRTYNNHTKESNEDTPREAVYWYDVPLAAVPVVEKDWPKMPEYMNGRQYFLWWKNEFKTNKKDIVDEETGEITAVDVPEIHNPLPRYEKLEYKLGGEDSRMWGVK